MFSPLFLDVQNLRMLWNFYLYQNNAYFLKPILKALMCNSINLSPRKNVIQILILWVVNLVQDNFIPNAFLGIFCQRVWNKALGAGKQLLRALPGSTLETVLLSLQGREPNTWRKQHTAPTWDRPVGFLMLKKVKSFDSPSGDTETSFPWGLFVLAGDLQSITGAEGKDALDSATGGMLCNPTLLKLLPFLWTSQAAFKFNSSQMGLHRQK